MADKISHQRIQHITVEFDYSRHCYSNNRHAGQRQPRAVSIYDGSTKMIKSLKFASIPTRDQDAAIQFWTQQIGFRVLTDQPMGPGKRWIELGIGHAETRIVLFTPDGQENRIGTFFNGSFACDDVEYTYKQLQSKGVQFEAPPEKQSWGTFAKFRDPDGNIFVLSSG
jgi:predicted enzyme related to lactoylglutathione lyase